MSNMILSAALLMALLPKGPPYLSRVRALPLRTGNLESVQLSPDGHLLLATRARKISMYRLPSGALLWSKAKGVAEFTPDSKGLVTARRKTIDLYRAETGKPIVNIENANGPHDALKVSFGGKTLLAQEDPVSVSCWSLATRRRLWTQRIPAMGAAEGKVSDRLGLVPLDDGSAVVTDTTVWQGEPLGAEWTMWSFQSDGRIVGISQSHAIHAEMDSPIEIPERRIAFSNNKGETWFTTVTFPSLQVVTLPGAPDANISKMWRCGSKVLILDNGESILEWPATGGAASRISLHRRIVFDPLVGAYGENISEWLTHYDISADGRTVVVNEGNHLTLFRIIGG